ncbi:hypothetical protein BC628DRAFT_153450 [Trametes gibbosa]|nr:hypothetical protein BC628DRAFT_153450 [Trametes gibbosa]
MALHRSRLPSHVFLSPESAEAYNEMTRKGTYTLTVFETMWRDKHPYLLARGYSLRPRYAQDWQPSWVGTNIDPYYCEDSILSGKMSVIDGRSADGELVAIKHLQNKGQEIEIAGFLTSAKHPNNHCIPIMDLFPDPEEPNFSFMVMPYLRPFNNPEFELIVEVAEFIRQMLEIVDTALC